MTVLVAVREPEVPVIVTVYVPALVPGVEVFVPPPLLQPCIPPARASKTVRMPNAFAHWRLLPNPPKKNRQANVTPPPRYNDGKPLPGSDRCACEAAAVVTMRVAVPEPVPVMLTGLVVPKLRVGRY